MKPMQCYVGRLCGRRMVQRVTARDVTNLKVDTVSSNARYRMETNSVMYIIFGYQLNMCYICYFG